VRDPRERIADMIEAIERIERYADRSEDEFRRDELVQTWFLRHLQIIGEAARAIPEELRASESGIEWKKITGMRHVLVHDYFGIDLDLVWRTVKHDLGSLKKALITLQAQL
jgi:uncharacterized protein with HEPN domain